MALKADIVLEYLEKYSEEKIGRFIPSLTLARLIYNENVAVFNNLESTRTMVRLYRGQNGKNHRDAIQTKKFYTDKGSPGNFVPPPSEEQKYSEYNLGFKSIGVISDIHVPYHNEEAITAAIRWLYDRKIDCLFINGDLIDFYQGSKYMKDPRKRDMKYEIDMTNEFLDMIQDTMPGVKLVFKKGNHDERLENYMYTKAPELLGFPEWQLEHLLHSRERNMDIIGDQRIVRAGHLSILHGHELNSPGNSVNPARGTFMRTKQSCMVGHSHVSSSHTETKLDGDIITTWSTGCLCELHPRYARINKWNHGFAHIKVEGSGDYRVKNLRVWKGNVL